ncbi:N-acetyltransferase [Cohnella endophytica]|uniref:N-acetyltransferase n=1 Tax=Cohnella endophytica TaxID=2419778 RepID=A0A494Y8Q1_9BACL|nr:GNAT family N-acetyltransferase [Cohnella endophytica]RKP57968.1 N-acetyltransferase [Cohnella endophytica]
MSLQISNEPKSEYKEYVRNKMYEYNLFHFPVELRGRYQELNLYLIDSDNQITGGIVGEFCWNWLEIQYLFVEQAFRKMGYGRKLLLEAEKIAKEKQCDFIKLDTLSFQALDFYKKEGFEIFGTIENAGGHTYYYLKKDI